MKYLLPLALIFICFSCKEKHSEPGSFVIYDQPASSASQSFQPNHSDAGFTSKLESLLIDHYKAGWMDASNQMISLHNKDKLTEKNVLVVRNKDWRKFESEIAAKRNRVESNK